MNPGAPAEGKRWNDIPWHGRALYSLTAWAIRRIPAYRDAMNWAVAILALKGDLPALRPIDEKSTR